MNENKKKLLIVFGIYYLIAFILGAISCFLEPQNFIKALFWSCTIPLIIFFGSIIIFSPAIIILYFLFKKYKKPETRRFLIAFLIPFSNMIYYFIECFTHIAGSTPISIAIGGVALTALLPLLFIITIFIPKSLFEYKIQTLKTIILMEIYGWLLVIVSLFVIQNAYGFISRTEVIKYQPIINKIESYKNENGTYPENIENMVKKKKYNYELKNNGKDFVLTLYHKEYEFMYHRYCSNEDLKDCNIDHYDYKFNKEPGTWIKVGFDED